MFARRDICMFEKSSCMLLWATLEFWMHCGTLWLVRTAPDTQRYMLWHADGLLEFFVLQTGCAHLLNKGMISAALSFVDQSDPCSSKTAGLICHSSNTYQRVTRNAATECVQNIARHLRYCSVVTAAKKRPQCDKRGLPVSLEGT